MFQWLTHFTISMSSSVVNKNSHSCPSISLPLLWQSIYIYLSQTRYHLTIHYGISNRRTKEGIREEDAEEERIIRETMKKRESTDQQADGKYWFSCCGVSCFLSLSMLSFQAMVSEVRRWEICCLWTVESNAKLAILRRHVSLSPESHCSSSCPSQCPPFIFILFNSFSFWSVLPLYAVE